MRKFNLTARAQLTPAATALALVSLLAAVATAQGNMNPAGGGSIVQQLVIIDPFELQTLTVSVVENAGGNTGSGANASPTDSSLVVSAGDLMRCPPVWIPPRPPARTPHKPPWVPGPPPWWPGKPPWAPGPPPWVR